MKKIFLILSLLLSVWGGAEAETLSVEEKSTGDWADGVTFAASQFADTQAGDVISVTITALNDWTNPDGDPYWQYALRLAGDQWQGLVGFNGGIAAIGTYSYTLTEANVTAIKEYGLNVTGKYITFTTVELTRPEAQTSFIIWKDTPVATGNWENAVQIGISDISSAAIAEGDVLRIYTTDVLKDGDVIPQISLSYSNSGWAWTDFVTSYGEYDFSPTTAYADFAITGELLSVLTAENDEKALVVRGKNYTITKVEIIKEDAYYVNLSDQYTALYLPGTAAQVNITRTLSQGYNTITLPFVASAKDLTDSDEAWLAELSGVDTEDGIVLTFTKVAETVANKPYLIYVPENVSVKTQTNVEISALVDDWHNQTWSGSYYMQGNYSPALNVEGKYVVSGSDAIAPAGSTATLDGMRAYITVNGGSIKENIRFVVDDAETAIRNLSGTNKAMTIYNLAGLQVKKMCQGIYVVGNKKVLVK